MSNLGLNLKKLRKAKGLNQDELAQILGVGKTTISNYETGYTAPPSAMLLQLAEFFNVTVDELANGKILINAPVDETKKLKQGQPDFSGEKIIPVYLSLSDDESQAVPIHELKLPVSFVGDGAFFGLKISGDRMDRAALPDGSVAIIRRQALADDGDIAAVSLGDNPIFVCRFYRMGENITLFYESNNPVYRPLMVNTREQGLKIHGKVVKSIQSIF